FFYAVIAALFFFFFFQAEDGIRDFHVTGVQTCALPICPFAAGHAALRRADQGSRAGPRRLDPPRRGPPATGARPAAGKCHGKSRSEERRVGKECRSGRSAGSEKKKK